MLTLRKAQHGIGFSAMNADELFFINGGSGSGYNCYMGGGKYVSSPAPTTQPSIPSPISMPDQTQSLADKANSYMPSGIKVGDQGLSAPFGNGRLGICPSDSGATVSWRIQF